MLRSWIWAAALTASTINAQSTVVLSGSTTQSSAPSSGSSLTSTRSSTGSTSSTSSAAANGFVIPSQYGTASLSGSQSIDPTATGAVPTGSYISYATTLTLTTGTRSGNGTNGTITSSGVSSTPTVTLIGGTNAGTSAISRTTTANTPVNTQPCNNYPELCNRKYSNITEVAAHNWAFHQKNNAASNQLLDFTQQLNDGVRMLTVESHVSNNGTAISLCHTSCDLLDAGTLVSHLTSIRQWIDVHPYDVVTILLVNSDKLFNTTLYIQAIQNSGMQKYAYSPPKIPMARDDWPTLGNMILQSKRAVLFLDYNANQTAYPYLLDEFSQVWETPFSPTDPSFPCTQQRPPSIDRQQIDQRMYIANHNLNAQINLLGIDLLVPNTAQLNTTNAVSGSSSLGQMAEDCTSMWNYPPNWLLVDYYNYGNYPGSVFEVAAKYNNVTYNRQCCGIVVSAASHTSSFSALAVTLTTLFALVMAA